MDVVRAGGILLIDSVQVLTTKLDCENDSGLFLVSLRMEDDGLRVTQ